MNFVALKMLTGDRAKYLGLIFAIAFSTFLLENQSSIFAGIMKRTASQILDVTDADIWVMDPKTQYIDEVKPLKDNDVYKVRGVPGVDWAVRLFRGMPVARTRDGAFRQAILMGVDDATLAGAPAQLMLLGSVEGLRDPETVIIDRGGFLSLFPDRPLRLGDELEMNDRRVRIAGIAEASAPFATFPVMFSRYSQAVQFLGRERNQMSFVLVKARADVTVAELTSRIRQQTGLAAATTDEFAWQTIEYYLRNTGIPINFGITILVALIVGAVVAGQTFYMFTIDNLKQFAALKAIGVKDSRLTGMVLLQAWTVAGIGYAIGTGLCAAFHEIMQKHLTARGIVLMWQSTAWVALVIFVMVTLASLLSIRRVVVVEPALVFRA